MTTIFIPSSAIQKKQSIRLAKEKSHYLANVMRLRRGDTITVIDGCGKAFLAEICSIENEVLFIRIINEVILNTEPPFEIALCQSLIKGDKMDFVIQKATELGVNQIAPLITERTVVKETRKLNRWRKITEEAAEQCSRTVIPIIHEPVAIQDFIIRAAAIADNCKLNGFIFWEEGGESLTQAFKKMISRSKVGGNLKSSESIYIIIGPEGGLTQREVELAEENGLIKTSLGKRLLKSETASIAAVAIIQFMLEEFLQKCLDGQQSSECGVWSSI